MHVLSVEHVVDMAPSLFVVFQAVFADGLAGLPVSVDQFLENNGIALCDVDSPFMQPPCAVRCT
jgi:hypothetical protein